MFPSLRYTRLDPGCSLRAIYMTNGCIIPGITQLVKSFFYKNGKKVCVPAVRPPEKVSPGCAGGYLLPKCLISFGIYIILMSEKEIKYADYSDQVQNNIPKEVFDE